MSVLDHGLTESFEDHDFEAQNVVMRIPKRPATDPIPRKEEFDIEEAFRRHVAMGTFPPTNFHLVWPERPAYDRNASSARAHLIEDEGNKGPKRSKDFPRRLKSHSARLHYVRDTVRKQARASTPGEYSSRRSAAVGLNIPPSVRPPPPKAYTHGIVSTPAPGSYTPVETRHVSSYAFSTPNAVKNTHSNVHADPSGPGYYEVRHAADRSVFDQTFSQTARFRTAPPASAKGPGPGQYHTQTDAVDAHTRAHVFRQNKQEVASVYQRARGPGSYDVRAGENHRPKMFHKFNGAKRFQKDDMHPDEDSSSPMQVLLLSDARKRSGGVKSVNVPKPDLREYTANRKSEKLRQKREQVSNKMQQMAITRQKIALDHLNKMDRIVNKTRYRSIENQRRKDQEHAQRFTAGWLFYVGLASRTHVIATAVGEAAAVRAYDTERAAAARVIQGCIRAHLRKKQEAREAKAAQAIYRCLKRNIIRQRVKKKRKAGIVFVQHLGDRAIMKELQQRLELARHRAVLIQRAWRRYARIRDNALLVLRQQWTFEVERMAKHYKLSGGGKEKQKKKGKDDKKQAAGGTFPLVAASVYMDVLLVDFKARRAHFYPVRHAWQDKIKFRDAEIEKALTNWRNSTKDWKNTKEPSPAELGISPAPIAPFFSIVLPVERMCTLIFESFNMIEPKVASTVQQKIRKFAAVFLKKDKKVRDQERAKRAAFYPEAPPRLRTDGVMKHNSSGAGKASRPSEPA